VTLSEQQIKSFISGHTPNDGWIVYHFSEDRVDNLSLMHLPGCLRERYPAALKSYSIAKQPTLGVINRIAFNDSPLETPSEAELESNGWIGSMEIEWLSSPIHFCSVATRSNLAEAPLVVVATKSTAVLREFLRVVCEYGHSRQLNNEILVVNGDNIAVPKLDWEELVLPVGMAEEIRENVEAFFQSRERYREMRIPYRRGFLFAGPPGCGKTLAVKVLASNIKAKVITVLAHAEVGDYILTRAFYLGKKYAPAIVVFEELDKLVESEYVSLAHFLNLIDGLSMSEGILLVATTNDPGKLDPALLHRPSRFDRVWKFPLPDYEQRLALLRKRGRVYFSEEALGRAARNSAGFSMAYVQEIVVNALLQNTHNGIAVTDEALLKSLEVLKSQRRAASRDDEKVEDRESVGFGPKQSK
jgi:ATPase family protein associated with various cellular activities (AAA)